MLRERSSRGKWIFFGGSKCVGSEKKRQEKRSKGYKKNYKKLDQRSKQRNGKFSFFSLQWLKFNISVISSVLDVFSNIT